MGNTFSVLFRRESLPGQNSSWRGRDTISKPCPAAIPKNLSIFLWSFHIRLGSQVLSPGNMIKMAVKNAIITRKG